MATKSETDETDKKIARLETRVSELERLLQDEKTRRVLAEAKYDGYSAAVKDLGSRDRLPYPMWGGMFQRPY